MIFRSITAVFFGECILQFDNCGKIIYCLKESTKILHLHVSHPVIYSLSESAFVCLVLNDASTLVGH